MAVKAYSQLQKQHIRNGIDNMRYFGIIRPSDNYVGWISHSDLYAWQLFFNDNQHKLPIAEAIKAYESIGYMAVELDIKVKEKK